jgi:hypothetical protein
MSREGLELPLLGALRKLDGDELPIDDLVDERSSREIDRRSLDHWLKRIIEDGDPEDPVERFWMARLLVDVRRRGDRRTRPLLMALATRRLEPYESRGQGSTSAKRLLDGLDLLQPGEPISQDALDAFRDAFHGVVDVQGLAAHEQVQMSGSGAELATLFLELGTLGALHCDLSFHRELVDGVEKEVIRVEVDTCTNRAFASCKKAINPTQWPKVNPFFQKVEILGTPAKLGADWAGIMKEKVGPGINGKVYETDLAVTYAERPGTAIAAFDLAPIRTDPGMVTVDRGFLSCTDEGIHRRIRTVKVYRIEDLKMPASWICPLWASQFALAAWWGGS